ncbi:unnamed protein product [Brassica napus]|uniref:(rape) hypothetical protein n=1 Tax=Brassica napus TaxID=3708 RepID=A0A816W9A7_BRANA|nr:unnamed protein product [Brassica napus]
MKIQADGEEYKSDNTGQDDKVDLFEKCLTASDVGSSNLLVVTPKEDVQTNFISHTIIGPENYLRLTLETLSSSNGTLQTEEDSSLAAEGVKSGIASRDDAALNSTSADTYAKALEFRDKLKEVETPIQPKLSKHNSITGSDPVFVIYCGDNQDSEEVYLISYIFNELRLRGFIPLRYDLTSGLVTRNPEMLYKSRVCVIIFSMNYAHSRECMDEFVENMRHLNKKNVVKIPVFFKVSFSEVRGQSGSFEEAFTRLGNLVEAAQVLKWREALLELPSINKYQYTKGDEVILAKKIVGDVCLMVKYEMDDKRRGTRSQLDSVMSLLKFSQSSAPRIVGLWGMAGIGKTTITGDIVRTQAQRFDVCYFQPDFHLMCQTKGLSHLREEFFSKLFGEENVFKDACDTKLSFVRDRLLDKRVLIVLDGVSSARDVEAFLGGFGWFSGGHTIIFTSRNRQVLVQCNAQELYSIPKLTKDESIRICLQCGCKQVWTRKMSELMKYASGIPLALSVLASSVEDQYIKAEKNHLRRLRQHPPVKIQDAFRISFDGRDDNEKSIFLDLACFFRGKYKKRVVNILDGCGFFTDLGIQGLIDESLISLVDDKIVIPNIFQDTGRFLVRQENKEAGKRSRLWDSDDIADVLIKNSGTEAIEGIFLDLSGLTFALSPTVFEMMYRLRFLKLHCPSSDNHCKVSLPEGLHSLPDELRLLHWERYPLGSLPRNFNPKNLVELNMPYSNLTKLWKGTKNLEKLKMINLSHSRQLTKFPRLSKAKNLEHIDLEGCTSLVKVNSSIIRHHNLTFLSLKDCSHLQIMPTTVHLESLEVLNLSGCSELEDLQDFSPNLKEVYLAGTAIREMPSSLEDLTRLVTLDLENCERLQHLPPGISNLKAMVTLKLSGCSNLKSFPILDALCLSDSERHNTKITMEESVSFKHHSGIQESRLTGAGILNNFEVKLDIHGFCFSRDAAGGFIPGFKYLSADRIPQESWLRVTISPLPSLIVHSLASRLYALVSLFLYNA